MPLRADQGFLPQFDDIPPAVLEQSKMMVLSYPNNPTTATASLDFWQKARGLLQSPRHRSGTRFSLWRHHLYRPTRRVRSGGRP